MNPCICPKCRQEMIGRATDMENFLRLVSIPKDESVGQVMIIIPINTIITIVDVAFIAAAIVLMIICRQIQEQEATLNVLHKELQGSMSAPPPPPPPGPGGPAQQMESPPPLYPHGTATYDYDSQGLEDTLR